MKYFACRQADLTPTANTNVLGKEVVQCVELSVSVGNHFQSLPY